METDNQTNQDFIESQCQKLKEIMTDTFPESSEERIDKSVDTYRTNLKRRLGDMTKEFLSGKGLDSEPVGLLSDLPKDY